MKSLRTDSLLKPQVEKCSFWFPCSGIAFFSPVLTGVPFGHKHLEKKTYVMLLFLKFSSQCFFSLMSDLFCQNGSSAAPAEENVASSPCSISLSELVSSLDSISLTVSTPGQNCSFTVTSPDTDGIECRQKTREEEALEGSSRAHHVGTDQLGVEAGGNKSMREVFTCVLDHLEPGTTYQLQVQSKTDQESANITAHTSKS